MKHHQIPEKVRGEGPKSDFLLQLVAIWVYQSIPFKGLHITTTKSLIPVPPGHMAAQGIFSLECFLAVVAIVAKMPREVGAFYMIPHIGPISFLLFLTRTRIKNGFGALTHGEALYLRFS